MDSILDKHLILQFEEHNYNQQITRLIELYTYSWERHKLCKSIAGKPCYTW